MSNEAEKALQIGRRRCWRTPSSPDVVMFHGVYQHSFIAHAHDAITVIQVTGGAVQIEVDTRTHIARPGQLVLIGANQVHAAQPLDTQGWSMRSLHLPPEFFDDVAEEAVSGSMHFGCPLYPGASSDHAAFGEWHAACEAGSLAQAEASYIEFSHWLQDSIKAFAPHVDAHPQLDARITRAKAILGERVFDNETLDEIAETVGLSSFSLIRGFTKSFGLPPHTWRMQARARAAADLIRAHESLADVAGSCGFTDQSHLARVFKRVYGVTPGQYRSID